MQFSILENTDPEFAPDADFSYDFSDGQFFGASCQLFLANHLIRMICVGIDTKARTRTTGTGESSNGHRHVVIRDGSYSMVFSGHRKHFYKV